MKKLVTIISSLLLTFLLVSCEVEIEEPVVDTVAPILFIKTENNKFFVEENSSVDLDVALRIGVSAIDNIDKEEDIKIFIDYSLVDLNKPGEYEVLIYAKDKAGNSSEIKIKTVVVTKKNVLINTYPVYLDTIIGESAKPGPQKVFDGAYYYKVESSRDKWEGIEGTITLPEFDIKRYDRAFDDSLPGDPNAKNLDNPSIYMGGKATHESDVGLSLSKTKPTESDSPSLGSIVYRPFWRYMTSTEKDIGDYDLLNGRKYAVSPTNAAGTNMIANWTPYDTEFYYLPGDKVRIIIYSPKPNYLQLQIEILEKTTIPYYVEMRKEFNEPKNFFSPIFRAPGNGTGENITFKRVNAIDQSSNEGKTVIPTNTNVKEAVWESVYLRRKINGVIYRVPLNDNRTSQLGAPDSKYYEATQINETTGGQTVIIKPNNG